MLNCSVIQACWPIVWTCAASVGVGPKAARSRNRLAAAADASAFGIPTCTANGAEEEAPLLTVSVADPDCAENPLMVSAPFEKLVTSGVLFSCAVEVARNPLPVSVALKSPRGRGFVLMPVIVGAGGINVTIAVAVPLGPVAETLAVPLAVSVEGAVYKPEELTAPAVALQEVAPAEVNC